MTFRRISLATTAIVLGAAVAPAQAGDRTMYFTVGGGLNLLQDQSTQRIYATLANEALTFDPNSEIGFVLHAAVGTHVDNILPGLELEVEASYRQNQADGNWIRHTAFMFQPTGAPIGDESTWAVLANAWYEMKMGNLRPYIGGGAGWGEAKIGSTSFEKTSDGFAWQIGGGVNFSISSNVSIGVGYRYFDGPSVNVTPDNALNPLGDVDQPSQSVTLDLTFAF